jgi:hypothetical protein
VKVGAFRVIAPVVTARLDTLDVPPLSLIEMAFTVQSSVIVRAEEYTELEDVGSEPLVV